MEQLTLEVVRRHKTGTGPSRRMRRQGKLPGVLYGGQSESIPVEINHRSFVKVLQTSAGGNVILNVKITGDGDEISKMAIIKEMQEDPITGGLTHVDLYEVSLDKKISVSIPVVVTGESAGVKEGGVLQHILREIEVECLPTRIPPKITVDISQLKIGDVIHVKDLPKPDEVEVVTGLEKIVLSIVPPTVITEAPPVAAEEVAEPELIREKKPEKEMEEEPEKEEKAKPDSEKGGTKESKPKSG